MKILSMILGNMNKYAHTVIDEDIYFLINRAFDLSSVKFNKTIIIH